MRRLALATIVLVISLASAGSLLAVTFPDRLDLPDGFAPEGIATGRGTTFYTGSLAGRGILVGDYRTGETEPLVTTGGPYVGMKVDAQNQLWVAGGPAGVGYIFDADTGDELQVLQLAPSGEATFVNDVVVTDDAAWFTDSWRGVIYRVDLADGSIGEVDLTEVPAEPFVFRLNGIDATPNGDTLIAVNSTDGELYRIDVASLDVITIELGENESAHGDGILLHGLTLYVVRNQDHVAVIELAPDLSSGAVVAELTGEFDVPTTVARFGASLYVVNAAFRPPGSPPATDFWVTKIAG